MQGTPLVEMVVVTAPADPETTQGAAASSVQLNGAGATFPFPLYSRWFYENAFIDSAVKFNYPSIGPGGGIRQITKKNGGPRRLGCYSELCIDRAIAVQPEVILMDEPASALDPTATLKIEELLQELKKSYTIVIVTHNMQQAARVLDLTGMMMRDDRAGELIEFDAAQTIFTKPKDRRTEDYATGRFG